MECITNWVLSKLRYNIELVVQQRLNCLLL